MVDLEVARRKLAIADHILTQTYPLVRDPKLLLAVLQNLADALDSAVTAVLAVAVAKKRIVASPQDAEARLSALRGLNDVAPEFFRFCEELRELLKEHQHSPVEFVRREQLVICDDAYKVHTLSEPQLKGQLHDARKFLADFEKVIPA